MATAIAITIIHEKFTGVGADTTCADHRIYTPSPILSSV
jgi:hypothetical protein